jgi:hypothetical protein
MKKLIVFTLMFVLLAGCATPAAVTNKPASTPIVLPTKAPATAAPATAKPTAVPATAIPATAVPTATKPPVADGAALKALKAEAGNINPGFTWVTATWVGDPIAGNLVKVTNELGDSLLVYIPANRAANFSSGVLSGWFIQAKAPEADFINAGNEVSADAKVYFGTGNLPTGWLAAAPETWSVWVNDGVYKPHLDKAKWSDSMAVPFGTTFEIGKADAVTYFQGWNRATILYRMIVEGPMTCKTDAGGAEGSKWNTSGSSFEDVLVTFDAMNDEQLSNWLKNSGNVQPSKIYNIYLGNAPVPTGWSPTLPTGWECKKK